MFASISVKFLGPTKHRPARLKATCQAGSITVSYSHKGVEREVKEVARALIQKVGWNDGRAVEWHGGASPDGKGWVFVCCEGGPDSATSVTFPKEKP
jgi:hypothetical protein